MLQVNNVGGVTKVSFEPGSKLNVAQASEVKAEFVNIVKGTGGRMELDMKNLEYVDSSGVGALLSLLRLCREFKWDLTLMGLQPSVRELFNLLQLHTIFKIK